MVLLPLNAVEDSWVGHWSSVDVAPNVLESLTLFVRIAFFFSNGMYVCVCACHAAAFCEIVFLLFCFLLPLH